MSNKFSSVKFFHRLASPLVCQFPIFFICVALYGLRTVRAVMVSASSLQNLGLIWKLLAFYGLIGYLFAVINHVASRRWVKVFSYFVILSLFLIDIFLTSNFELKISPTVLLLLGETNSQEASEFLSSTLWSRGSFISYAYTAILLVAVIAVESLRLIIARILSKPWMYLMVVLGACVILCGGIASATMFYAKLFKCKNTDEVSACVQGFGSFPTDPYSEVIYSAYAMHLASAEIQMALHTARKGEKNDYGVITSSDSINVVLVIGESFIKHHASLYGYELETTPFMNREREAGRLFAFDNAVAPYNLTSKVLRNMLFCNSLGDRENWHEALYMPLVFKQVGFDVLMWDNQRDMSKDATFSFALNSFLYDPEISRLSYTQTNTESFSYDEQIVDDFAKNAQVGAQNFVIFHLMGQHVDCSERFPHDKRFERFGADSIRRTAAYLTRDKLQRIADYDNATLYNDYVLSTIAKHFDGGNTVLVYLSDHGEEVYDYRDSFGRVTGEMTRDMARCQYEIPFVVWCSEKFMRRHPDLCAQLAAACHKPLMSDNICHLLFHLAGIETPVYKPTRDVINPGYACPKRIICDSTDYDVLMN